MKIFISYRRDDSIIHAQLLHNELVARFGNDVFMDIDDIGYGTDFVQAIDTRLESADVVLVVIGPRWAEMLEARLRGDDWVRHEVAGALQLRAKNAKDKLDQPRVLPVLVGGALPPSDPLLPDIAGLQRLAMLRFDEHALNASLNTLVEAIKGKSHEVEVRELQDELRGRRRAKIAGALIGSVMIVAGWFALFDLLTLDTRLDSATMWLANVDRTGNAAAWSGQVVLVGIDERTLTALGRKEIDTSWRAEHARIIENAAVAGARAVAFDIFLEDKGSDEKANVALERALVATRATLPVVFAVGEMKGHAPEMLPRFEKLAHWGLACGGRTLGVARSMLLAVRRQTIPPAPISEPPEKRFIVHPSLALAAFSVGGKVKPFKQYEQAVQVLLARGAGSVQVDFFATEVVRGEQPGCGAVAKNDLVANQLFDPWAMPQLREPPQRLAYERVLVGEAAALALLKDKIVVVGPLLKGIDQRRTSGGLRWGVEFIAEQIDAMTRSAAIRRLGGIMQWLLIFSLAMLGAIVGFRLRHRTATQRRAVLIAVALLFVTAGVVWYREQQQLIGLPYGLGALFCGAGLAVVFARLKAK